jgi:uncharacterized membrane protein required for colicin V production
MNWADWTIVVILVLSSLISIKRGFVKEALSLATWILAVIIALFFSERLAVLLTDSITTPSVREVVAFAILFIATLLVGAMVNYLIGEFGADYRSIRHRPHFRHGVRFGPWFYYRDGITDFLALIDSR